MSSKPQKRQISYNAQIERSDETTFRTVCSQILPKVNELTVFFPNSVSKGKNKNEEEDKLVIKKDDLLKIFSYLKKGPAEASPYILYSFTYVHTDVVSDTVTTFKVDYRLLMYLIHFFYVRFPNDHVVKIKKETLIKLFDMLNLSVNDRIALIRFFLVSESNSYIEGKISTFSNFGNNNLDFEIPPKPRRVQMKKIKNIGGISNTIGKLPKTSFDDLNNFLTKVPNILRESRKPKPEPKPINVGGVPRSKREKSVEPMARRMDISLKVEPNEYPINLFTKDKKLKEIKKKTLQTERKKEVNEKRKISLRVKSHSFHKENNILYPFILRKLPEYGDSPMYLCGSLPQIGQWDTSKALQMDEEVRNDQLYYTKYVPVKRKDFPFEYKYFYIKDGQINWVGMPHDNYLTHPQYYRLVHTLRKNHVSNLDLNIRYLNDVDGLNVWDNRKKKLIDILLNSYCDVFFFQEITKTQFLYIDRYLNSAYEFVGVYRDSTDASEKCSISYNIFKYTLTDWGQFWLSSTPYVPGSNDFKNNFPRICTWAALKQINGVNLLFFNVHLDHVNFDAHLPCIKVVLTESEAICERFPDCKFVFLGGCFYVEEDDPVVDIVKSYGYQEVMFENSFNDFTKDCDRHWDYMFWKERDGATDFELKDARVLKEEGTIDLEKQMFVSDHFPIVAEFFINNCQ